jgi:YggT family protein
MILVMQELHKPAEIITQQPTLPERVVHIYVQQPAPKGHGMINFLELLDWAISLLICFLLLRGYFQYMRVPMYHPLGEWIQKITSPLIQSTRRVLPIPNNLYGMDWTPIIIAFVIYWLWHGLAHRIEQQTFTGYLWSPIEWFSSLPNAALGLVYTMIAMITWMVLLNIVMSWVTPMPIGWLDQAVNPWLLPLKKLIPSFYGLDLSPLVLLILMQIALGILDHFMGLSPARGLHAILGHPPF